MHEQRIRELVPEIRKISDHYSKVHQANKAKEELKELLIELDTGHSPMGYEDLLYLPDNTWSEVADVIIMCAQLAIQHDKVGRVISEMEFKVARQHERMRLEELEHERKQVDTGRGETARKR